MHRRVGSSAGAAHTAHGRKPRGHRPGRRDKENARPLLIASHRAMGGLVDGRTVGRSTTRHGPPRQAGERTLAASSPAAGALGLIHKNAT